MTDIQVGDRVRVFELVRGGAHNPSPVAGKPYMTVGDEFFVTGVTSLSVMYDVPDDPTREGVCFKRRLKRVESEPESVAKITALIQLLLLS
jgi:hypothetical protein